MIINHTDETTTDTDKLPDVEASILEKANELQRICSENNRPLLLFICPSGYTRSQVEKRGWFQFFHLIGLDNKNPDGSKSFDIRPMFNAVSHFFSKIPPPQE